MNIKITTFSLIVAATCGLAFSQTVKAEEEENRVKPGNMRFDFGSNKYALDHVESRHHYMSTSPATSVHSGAAPKNLLGLDPGFLAKPAPLPMAAPVAQPQVSAKLASNNPFASVFGHPTQAPLSAPPAGAFGFPATPAKPLIAQAPHITSSNGVNGRVLHAKHAQAPRAMYARPASSPAVATYGQNAAFIPGQVSPMGSGSGNSASSTLSGVVLGHRR